MPDPSFIAIDLGTTSIKGAVLNLEQRRLEYIHHRPFPDPIPGLPPRFCEIDPNQIVSVVRDLLNPLSLTAPNCAGIVMCGQTGGLVLTTGAGAPCSNYISWRDQRLLGPASSGPGTYFDRLLERLGPDERRQLGNEVRPGSALSYLFWLSEEKQLPSGVMATALADFVAGQLCSAAPGAELTQAVGALNLETLNWHRAVFSELGLTQVRWPTLRNFREPAGQVVVGGRSVPCYAPVGDQQCALAGAFIDDRELSLNISTGSQVSLLTPRLGLGTYQTRPYFDGQFLNTITHIPAGRALNVLLRLFTELGAAQHQPLADPWPYIQQAVEAVSDTDLSVDLAFFPSPVGERGAISNIREDNLSVGDLFYAAFRNMADNYRACALRLSPNREWDRLVFSGGLAQKLELLRRMILARFECDHRLCASTEDTLLGLLVLALVVSGQAPSVATATESLRRRNHQLG
jgi:sugar (pentulose or hexulose) kinase